MQSITVRPAQEIDCPDLLTLIRELAVYEKLEREVTADTATLKTHLFGPNPCAHALLAHVGGELAGFCVYFYNFSTFTGGPGIYIEDIFVRSHYRSRGIGKRFFDTLCEIARENHCSRLEWAVLDWNQPAIDFYVKRGAKAMKEWTVYRLTQEQLAALPEEACA